MRGAGELGTFFPMGAVAAPSDGCSLQQAVWEGGFGTRAAARRTTGSSPPVIGSFQSLSKGRPLTSQSRRVAPSNDRDEPSDLPCLDAAMQLWLAGGKFLDKLRESSGNHGLQDLQYPRPSSARLGGRTPCTTTACLYFSPGRDSIDSSTTRSSRTRLLIPVPRQCTCSQPLPHGIPK